MAENTSVGQLTALSDGINVSTDTPDYAEWQAILHGDLSASDSPTSPAARTATTPEPSYSASLPSAVGPLGAPAQAQASSPPLPLSDVGTTSPTPIIGFSAYPQLSAGVDVGPVSQTVDPIVATFDVTTPGSGLVFDNSIAGNYSSNTLTEFENDVIDAETMLEKQATNSFTINVELEAANQGANGDGADNNSLVYGTYTYAQLKSALTAKESGNAIGQIALQHLPATDPSGGVGFYIPTAYARFLGLTTATGGVELANGTYAFSTSYAFDSAVILNTNYVSDYGQDAIDALTHELSESAMGRVGGLGSQTVAGKPYWTTMDLFRYTAAGQYDTTDGKDGQSTYFSYNGGQTTSASANLSFFNNYNTQGTFSGGDNDDWSSSSAPDIFGPVSTVGGLSQTDDQILESLGWDPVAVAPTVNVQNVSVGENTAISASAMIAGVSNPSGDTITEYIFDDQGANGHFIFNGTVEPAGVAFSVPVGSLSAVQYAAGTSPGTDSIFIELGYETPGSTTTLFSSQSFLTATTWLPSDFNGDGKSDILFQNTNGTPAIWEMNGTSIINAVQLPDPGPSWQIIGTGDFNGDGKSDVLFQNTNGTPAIWEMNGTTIINAAQLPDPGPSWVIIGTGDFTGDPEDDILFQNTNGAPAIWEMNGTTITDAAQLPNPGPSWQIVGTGDFNGDGEADILFQNTNGQPAIWEMNGTTIINAATLPNPGPSWHIIGTGDFTGNGEADILFQNTNGQPAIWEMNGTTITDAFGLPNPGPSWQIIGTGDFNGDGKSDILFQNTNGTPAIWEMNGATIINAAGLPDPPQGWHVLNPV